MKLTTALTLFVVVFTAALLANLIALKIAADQAGAALSDAKTTTAGSLLGLFAMPAKR